MQQLRFGVMLNEDLTVNRWAADCIRALIESNLAEPALLIINSGRTPKKSYLKGLSPLKTILFRVYRRIWLTDRISALQHVNLRPELQDVPRKFCQTTLKGKFSEYFSDEDILNIKEFKLDFILRFSFNIIRGEILEAARFGIWSYHHDDERRYRGGPACFWELYNGDVTTGAMLQRLTERLDGGIILHRSVFPSQLSYAKNLNEVLPGSSGWALIVCKGILAGQSDHLHWSVSTSKAPIYRYPDNRQFLWFCVKQSFNYVGARCKNLLKPSAAFR